jgi:putative transposase
MPSTHTNLHYHFVFATKDHIPLIRAEWRSRLHAYVGGIIKNLEGMPLAVGGIQDHIHILVGLKPSHRVDYVLRDIKADSSAFVRREIDSKFSWQKGYGAFCVSPSGIEAVRSYVLNQEAHHKSRTFKDEYMELLQKCNTPYDERFLW